MELGDFVTNLLLPMGSGLGGWFVGRRKRNAEVESDELKNVQSTLDIYTKIIDDLKNHIEKLEKRVDDLITENFDLKSKLMQTKSKLESLELQLNKGGNK